ncbi:MAG: hypothetical protein J6A30_04750 [Ruminococcus sp.]|nr:hypothetical protein [Ruminococcus sp.]
MTEKKSTYNAKAQKKYNADKKLISCKVHQDYYDKVVQHLTQKGYTSVNSYLLHLIDEDLNNNNS